MHLFWTNWELMGIVTAAWRPFLDPLNLHHPWHAIALAVPLVTAIALVYKALKLPTLTELGAQTLQLTLYILAMMGVAAGVLLALVELV